MSDGHDATDSAGASTRDWPIFPEKVRFVALELKNFLSYKDATLEFSDFIALIGPNASGKSNAVAAIRLLREIPTYGLPIAIARRGGFDQLRHRSRGHPNDPSLRLTFRLNESDMDSHYFLSLGAVKGGQYRIKKEAGEIRYDEKRVAHFNREGDDLTFEVGDARGKTKARDSNSSAKTVKAVAGQSALIAGGLAGFTIYEVLQRMQTVEVNPAKVGELQDPSPTDAFESDGSNVVSIFDSLPREKRSQLIDRLAAIVPGIQNIEMVRFADKVSVRFKQAAGDRPREFLAKQMSDGTLRAFAILLAMLQPKRPTLLVIEEPEIAIHLGALRTLVELLQVDTDSSQVLITTHSADIVDALPLDSLRVVWHEGGASRIGAVAEHTKKPIREGLITPGELLRSDSLDPECA